MSKPSTIQTGTSRPEAIRVIDLGHFIVRMKHISMQLFTCLALLESNQSTVWAVRYFIGQDKNKDSFQQWFTDSMCNFLSDLLTFMFCDKMFCCLIIFKLLLIAHITKVFAVAAECNSRHLIVFLESLQTVVVFCSIFFCRCDMYHQLVIQ